jgi:peptidoglycan/xylan/chitin deacetylase (PgdA/CDA1 family)
MKIIPPFKSINERLIQTYLLENGFEIKFSLKHKLYYNFIRPALPKKIRKVIQNLYSSDIKYREYFIFDDLVKLVLANIRGGNELDKLYPENHRFAIVLTHDVETEGGLKFIPRVIELEEKHGFRSSWNIVPYQYAIDKSIIELIKERGHEIGIHGYNHDGKLYYSEKIFTERAQHINEAIKRYGAAGFRSPMVHRNLLWLQKLNIKYDCSCFDYDPFQPFPGGTGSIWPFIAGKFVELPYTLPQDHTLFYILKEKNINIWRKKIDWLISKSGTILTLTHPDYLAEKNHLEIYEDLLKYLKSQRGGWLCLPRELTDWWLSNYQIKESRF